MVATTDVKPRAKNKQPKPFPAAYRRLSPARKLSWLGSEKCGALVAAGQLQRSAVEGEARRIEKTRVGVMQLAPSSAVVEDWLAGQPFPPPAENTPMRQADRMLCASEVPMVWPANYLRGGETYDVVVWKDLKRRAALDGNSDLNHGTTESPSALASAELKRRNAKLLERRLPADDVATLRRQIARYNAGLPTKILSDQI